MKSQKNNVYLLRRFWLRVAIVAGTVLLAIGLFFPLYKLDGPVAAVPVTVPVLLTGWYFGVYAGSVAGFAAVTLVAFLLALFSHQPWLSMVVNNWPGSLLFVAIGYLAGRVQIIWTRQENLLAELRSRERHLTLVNIAIRDILKPQSDEDRYYFLITHLANLYTADHAYFVQWDGAQQKAAPITTTLQTRASFSKASLTAHATELIASILEGGSAVLTADLAPATFLANPEMFWENIPNPPVALCIPLVAKNNKLGLVILAFNHVLDIHEEDIRYAGLAGSQLALALYTVQQEFKIEKQLKEARTLAKVGQALSETEQVGIETVLQLIVDSARELIPTAKEVVLHLIDNDRQILVPRAVSGIEKRSTTRLNMRLGEGIAGQAIVEKRVVAVSDTQGDARFLDKSMTTKFRSLIVAPIQSNERCWGTISVQSPLPLAFSADEIHLLGALGAQAAIAIENSNLLETTRQDLKQIDALYHLSQGLVASLDTDRLMKDVVNFLHDSFGYYHVQIFTLNPKNGNMVIRHGSGEIGAQLRKQRYHLPAGAGIIGHVVETGQAFVTNNVDDVVFFIRGPYLPDTQSEMTVPIKVEDRILGVLDIQQTPPGCLTERDLQLMTAVADQMAVALQKANLYSDLQAALKKEKSTRDQLIQAERLAIVGRLLASVSHELNNPLQAIQNALFLLKDEEKLSEQGSQDLGIILSETERMSAMIERLRAAYRPTRIQDLQNIYLNDMIDDVHALTATQMRHNNIQFEFLPGATLPVLFGIPDQIRQVILNLFVNAIEAMPDGGSLTVLTKEEPEESRILFSIVDSGPGIDREILPHIFEPFVTSKTTGTGLGLSIVYDIIRQHKGIIEAVNNPDGGATFNFWLPVMKEE
ncbi:MAG TPA: GAF domain-containing protein [Anaerolineales bacterium]|nr:GAF domain-containing protein [Anaerolineales bacterium]